MLECLWEFFIIVIIAFIYTAPFTWSRMLYSWTLYKFARWVISPVIPQTPRRVLTEGNVSLLDYYPSNRQRPGRPGLSFTTRGQYFHLTEHHQSMQLHNHSVVSLGHPTKRPCSSGMFMHPIGWHQCRQPCSCNSAAQSRLSQSGNILSLNLQ